MGIDLGKVAGAVAGGAAGILFGGPAGIPGAIAGAAGAFAGQSDPVQKALGTAAEAGGKIAEGIGEVIIKVTDELVEFAKDLIPGAIGIRPMRGSEKTLARKVFGETIEYGRVRIVSAYGIGKRPFCIPGGMIGQFAWKIPAVGPLLAWTSILSSLVHKYLIFLGDDGFRDAINHQIGSVADGNVARFAGQNLVHELTHVWQGHRRDYAPEYVFNSLWNQCTCGLMGKSAYSYTTGKQWKEYTPEQQAKIVEHWFVATNGGQPGPGAMDPGRQPYIDTNVRTANNDAVIPKSALGTIVSGLRSGPTMTQVLDILDTLKTQRTALMPYRHQIAIQGQIAGLDAQIAGYESAVRYMVSQGELIEDRARFAISMGAGPRVSSTAPAKTSPLLRR